MRNQLMEPFQQSFKLMFNTRRHLRIGTQLHVLKFVLFCDKYICTSRNKIFCLNLAKVIKGVGKVELKEVLDWTVVEDPFQTFEVFVVLLLHIEIGDWQVEDMLVEGRGKVGIEKITII